MQILNFNVKLFIFAQGAVKQARVDTKIFEGFGEALFKVLIIEFVLPATFLGSVQPFHLLKRPNQAKKAAGSTNSIICN